MADWAKTSSIDFTASGDSTSEVLGKLMAEDTAIYTLLNRLRKADYGASAPADPVTGHIWLDTSGATPVLKYYDGGSWENVTVTLSANPQQTPVRNCVLGCRVNATTGIPNWVGAGTGLTAQVYATDTNVVLAFGAGFDSDGVIDYAEAITSDLNPAWSGLPESGTAYLYVDRNISTGALTYGHSTVAPVYSTLTPATVTDKHWWNPATGIMQRWTGTVWETKQRIFVASVVTNSTTITSLTVYPAQDVHTLEASESVNTSVLTADRILGDRAYVKVTHTENANTAGGASSSGDWRTLPLNTEDTDTQGKCALTSNQVTLEAGTWRVRGWASLYYSEKAILRLRNVTQDATVLVGPVAVMSSSTTGVSMVEGIVTVASGDKLELQYRCSRSQSTNGLGYPLNWGENEVYACLECWKVVD